jgi:LuxR family transcriptional regulator, activator of conjugal transfer of Ti plasmids
MAETASMLGIAENTVRFYLVQARDKLGASNITHAVRIAVEHDLI